MSLMSIMLWRVSKKTTLTNFTYSVIPPSPWHLPERMSPWRVVQLAELLCKVTVLLQQIHPSGRICVKALVIVPSLREVNKLTAPHGCRCNICYVSTISISLKWECHNWIEDQLGYSVYRWLACTGRAAYWRVGVSITEGAPQFSEVVYIWELQNFAARVKCQAPILHKQYDSLEALFKKERRPKKYIFWLWGFNLSCVL